MRADPQLAVAEAYLEGLVNVEKERAPQRARLSLAPIRALLDRLGAPERGLSVVHVAGSKGKGSTALFAEAVLRAAGARVGTFTSPHLERWTERFRVDGEEVAPERLAAAVEQLRPHVDALRAAGGEQVPSFFDATTAAALLIFRDVRVDHAVLEVGLGGRLDSTNAVSPAVCCITSIELEHTDLLGDTLAAVAAEKAGILKPGVPAVCGDLPREALAVVERRAQELGCPLARLGREIEFEAEAAAPDLTQLRYREGDLRFDAELRVPGAHQAANAALAVAAVRRVLAPEDPARFASAARAGLAAAQLPARVEILSRAPWIVVDAAHTQASARALAEALQRLAAPVDFVLSISAGKDTGAILAALVPLARSLTLTRADPARSLDPAEIAAAARAVDPNIALRVVPNPHLALRAAREALAPDAVLCATGSVYLAGIARRVLRAPAPAATGR
ncbi:MAG: bifunctional folylpolyglutamate synthase/dihydrofolate synthase [Deltaproteobacteria bacterium]|nr:MAG: bifunctional folylpolyglutamate synthase/dihydrofolate synthase [Deltaproteobacteria bacterium]